MTAAITCIATDNSYGKRQNSEQNYHYTHLSHHNKNCYKYLTRSIVSSSSIYRQSPADDNKSCYNQDKVDNKRTQSEHKVLESCTSYKTNITLKQFDFQ